LELVGAPTAPEHKSIARHKKYPALGNKIVTFTNRAWLEKEDAASIEQGEEVTLMDWGNAIIDEIQKDSSGNVTVLKGRLHLEGSVKSTKKKLTWLPVVDDLVKVSIVHYFPLITKKSLRKRTSWRTTLIPSPNTRRRL